ncbi:hypothetical protein QJS04_geneDACA016213 [Acorus gramineus]|uniref:Uncharacterized protein n=1 Tax=Acorus gramineus TaxID=55184 RepID=A0AAV9AGI7_ACOGR|nr:hypothetical protein QJS04_geneDACA016213 [Acorus gramineus]
MEEAVGKTRKSADFPPSYWGDFFISLPMMIFGTTVDLLSAKMRVEEAAVGGQMVAFKEIGSGEEN